MTTATPHLIPYSLSDAICQVGIPSLEVGLAAARSGLVKTTDGEGTLHFEWDKVALNRRSPYFLERVLINLRSAVGEAYAH